MKVIAAVDKNWAIGKDGHLLVHLPGDLRYFKEKTLGKTVVMGRSTLESLPGGKPLPGRTNVILSRNPDFQAEDCLVCHSREELFEALGVSGDDVYIIGGEKVYREFLPYCDEAYITKIEAAFPADKYFEDLDLHSGWELAWKGEPMEEKGLRYEFTRYRKKEK